MPLRLSSSPIALIFKKSTEVSKPQKPVGRDLEQTLQAIYDSELNFTITRANPTGVDFSMRSYMTYHNMEPQDWHHVANYGELAEAIHQVVLATYPVSGHAKQVA